MTCQTEDRGLPQTTSETTYRTKDETTSGAVPQTVRQAIPPVGVSEDSLKPKAASFKQISRKAVFHRAYEFVGLPSTAARRQVWRYRIPE